MGKPKSELALKSSTLPTPTYDFVAFLKSLENKTWAEIIVAVQKEIRIAEDALGCAPQKARHHYEKSNWDRITYCHLLQALAEYIYNPREPMPDRYKPVFQTTSGLPDRLKKMVTQVIVKDRRQIPHQSPPGMERRRII